MDPEIQTRLSLAPPADLEYELQPADERIHLDENIIDAMPRKTEEKRLGHVDVAWDRRPRF